MTNSLRRMGMDWISRRRSNQLLILHLSDRKRIIVIPPCIKWLVLPVELHSYGVLIKQKEMGNPGKAPCAVLNNGAQIPLIGLGTASVPTPDHQIENAVITAIQAGYRHFDTASLYGSEPALGKALKKAFESGLVSREDVFVTTKLWCSDVHPDDVLPALQKSLGELQLDYLDLYLIHYPVRLKKGAFYPDIHPEDFLPVDIKSAWLAMEKCVELGLAKGIGLSNFSTKKIEDLLSYASIPPAVNQVEMHPLWQQKKMREYCKRVNVHVTAWSPLGASGTPWGASSVIDHPLIGEIARKHGKTAAQVALRWGIQQGVSLIPKSYNKARLYENISIFDWELEEEDLVKIEGFQQGKIHTGKEFVNPISGPYKTLEELWDGEI